MLRRISKTDLLYIRFGTGFVQVRFQGLIVAPLLISITTWGFFRLLAEVHSTESSGVDRDEDCLNFERSDALQQRNETRRSKDGVVILNNSVTYRTSDCLPNVGWFYNHAENDTV